MIKMGQILVDLHADETDPVEGMIQPLMRQGYRCQEQFLELFT